MSNPDGIQNNGSIKIGGTYVQGDVIEVKPKSDKPKERNITDQTEVKTTK